MRLIPVREHVGIWAARYIVRRITAFAPTPQRPFVLGLPTGGTPVQAYAELVRLHRAGALSFANVVTFNMDEYVGLAPGHPQSYRSFMHAHLFDHVDLKPENCNLLDGNAADLETECRRYEERIRSYGRIQLFLGGVGADGHLAFNEPGSSLSSRTRVKTLTTATRNDNARFFGDNPDSVPHQALTVGIATLLDAEELLILVAGVHKALALKHAVEKGVNHLWTISALQLHPKSIIVADEAAVSELRVKTLRYFQELEAANIEDPK